MEVQRIKQDALCVIGKLGSTADGEGFIGKLWQEANANYHEIEPLAKRRDDGTLAGQWGAMSDCSLSFAPWEDNFSKGLYLAGVQVEDSAEAPQGWVKWTLPAREYLKVKCDAGDTFSQGIAFLRGENIPLVGAVQEYYDPGENMQMYLLFPVG